MLSALAEFMKCVCVVYRLLRTNTPPWEEVDPEKPQKVGFIFSKIANFSHDTTSKMSFLCASVLYRLIVRLTVV